MKKWWLKCSSFPLFPSSQSSMNAEDEEKKPLVVPTRKPGGWKCLPFIIVNEACEKVASYGLVANLTLYLVSHFNMREVAAVNMGNIFSGTKNLAPMLGSFLSDAYWGRFPTLVYSSFATFLGMVIMTMTAAIPQLRPPSCSTAAQQAGQCVEASNFQMGILILSMGLLVLGTGGIGPCSLPFGVDQFDRSSEQGRMGLTSFFNWYYCTSTAAILVGMTLVVYIQDSISWTLGFSIPSVLMLVATAVFLLGTKFYVYVAPEGSIFSGIAQVFVASYRKRWLELPSAGNARQQESLLYNPPLVCTRSTKLPLTLQFRCLNKAAIVDEGEVAADGSPANKWRLCSVQLVEELKCLIRIVPIWASSIVGFMAIGQQSSFAVLQSLKMDRRLGPSFEIPAASVVVVYLVAITIFIPIYDRLIVPAARRLTGTETGITLLQRQGAGMVLNTLSMFVAAATEKRRRDSARASQPMSALWLAPHLVLVGLGEALNAVGQMEFLNTEFPEHMQSLAAAMSSCSMAAAGYASGVLLAVVRGCTDWLEDDIDAGRVDYLYYAIACMGVLNLLYFLVCARAYRYKGTPDVAEESDDDPLLGATKFDGGKETQV